MHVLWVVINTFAITLCMLVLLFVGPHWQWISDYSEHGRVWLLVIQCTRLTATEVVNSDKLVGRYSGKCIGWFGHILFGVWTPIGTVVLLGTSVASTHGFQSWTWAQQLIELLALWLLSTHIISLLRIEHLQQSRARRYRCCSVLAYVV